MLTGNWMNERDLCVADNQVIKKMQEGMQLLKDMLQIKAAADGQTPMMANQGQAMDGYSELHNYRAIAEKAQALVDKE